MWRNFTSQLPFLAVLAGAGIAYLLVRPKLGERTRRAEPLILLAAWAIGMAAVTLLPLGPSLDANNQETYRMVELNPVAEFINTTSGAVSWRVWFEQIVGNVILFLPAGVAMGMLAARRPVSIRVAFLTGPFIGLVVEVLQWALPLGRVASTADAIVYATASGLGVVATLIACRAVSTKKWRLYRDHAATRAGAELPATRRA